MREYPNTRTIRQPARSRLPLPLPRMRAWLPAMLLATIALPAHGQGGRTPGNLDQQFWLQVSALRANSDSSIRIDSNSSNLGTELNLENDLGLDDRKTLPAILLGARLGERWHLEFEHFRLDRTGRRSLSRDVSIGNESFPLSADLETTFDTHVYRLSAGYSLLRTPATEAGVAFGLHVTEFTAAFSGSLNGAALGSVRRDQLVPLPVIGLYGTTTLGPRWLAGARVDLFSLSYNDYDGYLLNAQANFIYRFTRNFGLGVGYRYSGYEVKVHREAFRGKVEFDFRGPQIVLDIGF